MELACRMCAVDTSRSGPTLSQQLSADGVNTVTPVEVQVTDTTRGFCCQECGGLTGYAIDVGGDEPQVVSISEHPADRFK